MNENKTNSNLEFRKIKSLKYLYEVNENGTILRNVKSKKQRPIKFIDGFYRVILKTKTGEEIFLKIHKLIAECWLNYNKETDVLGWIDGDVQNNHYSNLCIQRKQNKTKVRIIGNSEDLVFESKKDCAKYLSEKYGKVLEIIRQKLKAKRSHIYDYDIIYF